MRTFSSRLTAYKLRPLLNTMFSLSLSLSALAFMAALQINFHNIM